MRVVEHWAHLAVLGGPYSVLRIELRFAVCKAGITYLLSFLVSDLYSICSQDRVTDGTQGAVRSRDHFCPTLRVRGMIF